MGKIDTSGWKEFKLGYIMVGNKKQGHGLFKIVNSVAYHGKDVTETDSDDGINYITRSKFNNGLKARVVRLDKFKVNPAGSISFGAENADFFYQTEPYITGNKMYYIDTTALSERACRFLKSIMEVTFTANYSFSDGMIPARIYDECIKLPATHDGAPDWAYMESYMANLETKVAESLTMLQAAKDAEKKKVDTREWGEFRVGELFKKLNLRFLPNRVFDKASDISEVKSEEFNLPLVNAKHSNNGIMYYGRKHEWEYEVLTIDIVADGAASTGDVYAQPQETGVLYNAYLVKPKAKCVTGLILFFLSTVIQRCVKDHFGYDNKCTWDKVKHETILLPVDKTGQPDWAYMEEYMRKVEEKTENTLNQFMLV